MEAGQFSWFLTKVITGFYSGWFLMQYVPRGVSLSEMRSETMWFTYGLITMTCTFGFVLTKNG